MLLPGSRLLNTPVMGLQTGGELARTSQAIIDPDTLEIVAYKVEGSLLDTQPSLLRIADIREFSNIGFIIDSSDEFVAPDDIIKLKKIYDLGFELEGKAVIDEKKHKLGKVIDYVVETSGFVIQQLNVRRPLFKSLNDTELLVHRTQITEINDRFIVVHSRPTAPEPVTHAVKTAYINPFRKNAQVEHIRTNDHPQ